MDITCRDGWVVTVDDAIGDLVSRMRLLGYPVPHLYSHDSGVMEIAGPIGPYAGYPVSLRIWYMDTPRELEVTYLNRFRKVIKTRSFTDVEDAWQLILQVHS